MTEKRSKKSIATSIGLVAVFLMGALIMAYPTISNWWNENFASQAVFGYDKQVDAMNDVDCDLLFANAQAYNQQLSTLGNPFAEASKLAGYEDLLRIPSTDVMGYITVKKIDLRLPIYHGTDESVLAVGVGHLQGSSLPTGVVGEHTVLSAHRGLPSAKLFSSLDKLETGDTFTISVLKRKMTYRVDKISIVLPEQTEELMRQQDGSYCTLVTCTPYGVNTHRLLVRGVLIEGDGSDSLYIASEAFKLDPLMVAPVVAIPLLILVVAGMIVRSRRNEEDDVEL